MDGWDGWMWMSGARRPLASFHAIPLGRAIGQVCAGVAPTSYVREKQTQSSSLVLQGPAKGRDTTSRVGS